MKSIRTFLALASLNVIPSIGCAAPVDVNSANAAEIAKALSGIGEKTAQAIVDYRSKNGSFGTVQDLLNVKGIGPKTLEKNKQDIQLVPKP